MANTFVLDDASNFRIYRGRKEISLPFTVFKDYINEITYTFDVDNLKLSAFPQQTALDGQELVYVLKDGKYIPFKLDVVKGFITGSPITDQITPVLSSFPASPPLDGTETIRIRQGNAIRNTPISDLATYTGGGNIVTLGTLTLSGSLQVGVATSGTIIGATVGSTIVSNIPGITVDSAARTYSGTPTGSAATYANGLVETLAGATNTPKNSSISTTLQDEVLVVAGQSNGLTIGISGSGGLPAGWANTARVQYWNGATFVTYNPSGLSTWGPEAQYAMNWLAANAANTRKLYILKRAVSGSQLASIATYGNFGSAAKDWSRDAGSYYSDLKTDWTSVQAYFTTNSVSYTVGTVLWVQCEADSSNATVLAVYDTNEINIYNDIRTDIGNANTKIVTHRPSAIFGSYDPFGMLTKQQIVVANNPTKNLLFTPDGLAYQADTIHLAAASVNVMGGAMHDMTHGGLVPTNLAYVSSPIGTDSPENTSAGYLTCTCRDITGAVSWTLVGGSSEFVVSTSGLSSIGTIRVKTGATLVQGNYNLTVRATSPTGGTADLPVTVTVGAAGTGIWWNAASVLTLDYRNDQYRVNGTNYLGSAAFAAAPQWSAATNSVDLTGFMPSSATMLCEASVSPRNVNGSVPNALYALDDGPDGSATDEIFSLQRGAPSGSGYFIVVNKAGASQVSTTVTIITNYYQPLTAIKTAARIALNDMTFAINGTVATDDTSCLVPNITRLKLADRETGSRPWQGIIYKAELLNVATNDAGLITYTS